MGILLVYDVCDERSFNSNSPSEYLADMKIFVHGSRMFNNMLQKVFIRFSSEINVTGLKNESYQKIKEEHLHKNSEFHSLKPAQNQISTSKKHSSLSLGLFKISDFFC